VGPRENYTTSQRRLSCHECRLTALSAERGYANLMRIGPPLTERQSPERASHAIRTMFDTALKKASFAIRTGYDTALKRTSFAISTGYDTALKRASFAIGTGYDTALKRTSFAISTGYDTALKRASFAIGTGYDTALKRTIRPIPYCIDRMAIACYWVCASVFCFPL
jgi:hypothetical protein